MESPLAHHAARALLQWQIELGATEAIGDSPVNRFEVPESLPKPAHRATAATARNAPTGEKPATADAAAVARDLAASAGDLAGLRAALAGFELCELKQGARNLVFGDGNPAARVMLLGEAPGRDEDIEGRPFVGRAGQLLDKMLAAIGLARDGEDADRAVYISNILPWRPPQNRDPESTEIAMMLPFVERHVALVQPDILVLMGNISCQAMLGRRGITRLRGAWTTALELPVLPMFHPAYLLRNPHAKREAWHDLLMLQAKLRGG